MSQPVFTPRGLSLGAYGPAVSDVRGFLANPAGLPGLRDWDAEVVTSVTTASGGFVFDGVAVGKRLFDRHALAFQYTPGSELQFVLPSSTHISGLEFSVDRQITYAEPFGLSYAFRILPDLSVGVAGWLRTLKITDPVLEISDSTIVSVTNSAQKRSWYVDAGLQWNAGPTLTLALLGRGLRVSSGTALSSDFAVYERPEPGAVEVGGLWTPLESATVSISGGTLGTGGVGAAYRPWRAVEMRASLYYDKDQSPFVVAGAVGASVGVGLLEFECSYLHFANASLRGNSITASQLSGANIRQLALCPYAPNRLSIGGKVSLGNVRDRALHIDGVEIFSAVYPSSMQSFAFAPIGRVHVRNTAAVPVEAKAAFFIDRAMDEPTESVGTTLLPGEERDVPLLAVFNTWPERQRSLSIHDATVSVTVNGETGPDDQQQAKVVLRGRNDWDGKCESLRYFVRPEAPEVLKLTREILLARRDSLTGVPQELQLFRKAVLLFGAFEHEMVYVDDPKLSADFVQYPEETLQRHGGDCDDMATCFASLLGSIGIGTAFVDVVPPGKPEDGHVYLLFDTGLDMKFASYVSDNPKRYVLRRNSRGVETVWIPMETTLAARGFESAWTSGAEQYYEDVILHLAIAKGWVRVVDVQ